MRKQDHSGNDAPESAPRLCGSISEGLTLYASELAGSVENV